MKLLVVAATSAEISGLYQHFGLAEANFVQTPEFDILITGVGMTATAFALGTRLNPSYGLVLNVGIAGSFDHTLELGNLVNITTDVFAELGAEDHDSFLSIDQLGFGTNAYTNNYTSALPQVDRLPQVKGITVNKVHGNAQSIARIKSLFNPQVESMEGAAFFYACHQLQLPCLQIRSISNAVEPRAKENWKIGLAIWNLNHWLIELLSFLKNPTEFVRHQYSITFIKKRLVQGRYYYTTFTSNPDNEDIANHLANSDKRITEIQIEDIQKAMDGEAIEEHWGEVMGSQLEIFPKKGSVLIGYAKKTIPIGDFKQLLQEWLAFISSSPTLS
ncbi:futalosine hydrolase [Pedobacter sp. KR3-3]|uniref:Futalosine hydrolase n=1 Tax=Pedobacter albus TaxID=3113905 RepID=A0ABU7IBE9_9SPHI|nr:futalosine hydrolase [Pedobacter sp. KR3-3]MEE1946701.1 futalosine hydrolase [Pedobacter sp. KR3-3]